MRPLLLLLSLLQLTALASSLCHSNERLALLKFKESFIVDDEQPPDAQPCAPKTDNWLEIGGVDDCCSWDGVVCDKNTGNVIGLDLSSSCLYGSLNSSTSLFQLVHLRKLNLAFNNFNYSVIPSAFGNLSMLTHLNLSSSLFSGRLPSQISKLFRLSSLDLSDNSELKMPDLSNFIQNLTSLEDLVLSGVDIASPIPSVLANLSSLRSLYLENSGLLGEFPTPIFHLPNLQHLWLLDNLGLTGYLPEFNFSSQVKELVLYNTSFSGELPASIGNLKSLKLLGIRYCNFTGLLPSTLGNLPNLETLDVGNNSFSGLLPSTLGNLTKLQTLNLQNNAFTGQVPSMVGNLPNLMVLYLGTNHFEGLLPSTLGNLTKLQILNLQNNDFTGDFPASIGNLISLENLYIQSCQFTGLVPPMMGNLANLKVLNIAYNSFRGPIPPELTNLTQLTYLNLMENMLQGSIPSSISRLKSLELFDCDANQLNGTVEIDAFLELKQLKSLFLSLNNLLLISRNNSTIATTNPQLVNLGLRTCHLTEFPYFLHNQQQLQILDLSSNNIHGLIPKWMSEVSIETLLFLDLSNNSLTGFDDGFPVVLPWSNLHFLKLSSNFLRRSLPVPPFSTVNYFISNNSLTGEIPKLLCNQTSLSILDISHNNLTGEIPQCLSNFSKSLVVLTVGANNLHGHIPGGWASGNSLKMIDFSNNNLEGKIPRSLVECKMLQYLDLGNNQITDAFPSWLGSLPELNVILLSFNQLYGMVGDIPDDDQSNNLVTFPKLRIIDLSHNRFNGSLPSGYFERWNAMRSFDDNLGNSSAIYMIEDMTMNINTISVPRDYAYSMTFTSKGIQMDYPKIIQTLVAIDMSSNRFDGEIPESIGNLKEVRFLNLSNNNLVGKIPSSIAKLTNLEAVDLSRNKLTGGIPIQFAQLNFLSILNVSWNHLSGPLPRGQQFDTFQSGFFDGNVGLCGKPLLKECVNSGTGASPPFPSTTEDSNSFADDLTWILVAVGYACGLPIGMLIFHVVTRRKQHWFEITLWKSQRKRQRR